MDVIVDNVRYYSGAPTLWESLYIYCGSKIKADAVYSRYVLFHLLDGEKYDLWAYNPFMW